MEKQFCVYILASGRNGTLYAGVTSDLIKRVWQHKNNEVEGFTEKYEVHDLVWFEQHESVESAITREKQIKEWKRQWKLELIEKTNPDWLDLYDQVCGVTTERHTGESRYPVDQGLAKVAGLDTGFRRYDKKDNGAAMNLPDCKSLLLNLEGGVLHLTINRPESRNAMTPELLAEIGAVFEAIRESAVRAVVLRGAGGHFCAGADLKGMMAGGMKPPAPGEADPVVAMNRSFGVMLRQVSAAPQVVIAVCEGAVLGGGFGLACVSDIAFAHAEAKFGMPETTRGLPPAQIAPFVVERIGLTQARRLCLTGAQFRGAEALRLGLVHEGFSGEEELQAKLKDTLAQVMNCAPRANALTKQILLNVGKLEMDAVLDDAAQKFASCVRGPEAPEGIAAFMQKRAPAWAKN